MPAAARILVAALALGVSGAAGAPGPARAEVWAWVDDQGVTHLTNDRESLPASERERARSGAAVLRGLWAEGGVRAGEGDAAQAAAPPRRARGEEARIQRLLRGAVEDLERGETARAAEVFEGVLELEPQRPEAHWYLAHLDRQRGRLESAAAHLRVFLASAGETFVDRRAEAETLLAELLDERRLADAQAQRGPLRLVALEHPHFRIRYDAELETVSPGYAATVVTLLEQARAEVAARLGVVPREPTGVVLYGRAAYLSAYGRRFSFKTVGFFDGRIHVASTAHGHQALRALLYHEYVHALFREHTGSDRPFWLNEGLAELLERAARGQRGVSRHERALLRERIERGAWIPLRSLAAGFAGLGDARARTAYLQAAATAAWIEAHSDLPARQRLLALLGEGVPVDRALRESLGHGTPALESAVRSWLLAEFAPAAVDAP